MRPSVKTTVCTFAQIESALDAGALEMATPWGAFVKARRRGKTINRGDGPAIPVYMENEVEAYISPCEARFKWRGYRIVGAVHA